MVKSTTCRVVVVRACFIGGSLHAVGEVVPLSPEDAFNATQSTRCKYFSDEDRLQVHVAVEQKAKLLNRPAAATPHVRNPDPFVHRHRY